MDIRELCFELADAVGTSGDEYIACQVVKKHLEKFMPCKIDRMGNVIGTAGEGDIHILLDAHIDQIGLVARGIDEKGFVLIDKVGGIDLRTLIGAEVIVHGKEKLFGVICSVPPHLQSSSDSKDTIDMKKMAVDIGYTKEETAKLITVGDRITVRNNQHSLLNSNISSSAFDNRCSVAAILKALELVNGKIPHIKLSVLFSTQEETGGSGAKTGAFSTMPDYAVVVDVGFGDDPYTDKTQTIELSKGPSIGISPILDKNTTMHLVEIAKNKNIPYQHDVMGGRTGTNADSVSITGCGVKTVLLSVPLRYMHTANEIINVQDIENTAKLIAEFLLLKEAEFNA